MGSDRTDDAVLDIRALSIEADPDQEAGYALGVEAAHPYLWTAGAADAGGAPSCSIAGPAR